MPSLDFEFTSHPSEIYCHPTNTKLDLKISLKLLLFLYMLFLMLKW